MGKKEHILLIDYCESIYLIKLIIEVLQFCRHGVNENPFQEVEDMTNQSVVYVGVENTLAGLIYFEDQIREDAGEVIGSLSRQGISIYMLSGDKKNAAEYVASVIGIPKEKARSFSSWFFTQHQIHI